jgi:hypothetical protein
MARSLLAWIACFSLVAAAGCTMCANTYDECGPMTNGRCADGCGSDVRAGSILSGGPIPTSAPDALAGQALPAIGGAPAPVLQPSRPSGDAQGLPTQGWKSSKPAKVSQRGL